MAPRLGIDVAGMYKGGASERGGASETWEAGPLPPGAGLMEGT